MYSINILSSGFSVLDRFGNLVIVTNSFSHACDWVEGLSGEFYDK